MPRFFAYRSCWSLCSVQYGRCQPWEYDAPPTTTTTAWFSDCIWKYATEHAESTIKHGAPSEYAAESSQLPTAETTKPTVTRYREELWF